MLTRIDRATALTILSKIAFLAATAFALWHALTPGGGAEGVFLWDKLAHFTAFYVVTLLSLPAFPRAPLVALAAGLLGLGGLIEVLQSMPMIRRDAEWGDLAADALGVAMAMAPVLAWRLRGLGRPRLVAAAPAPQAEPAAEAEVLRLRARR